MTSEEFDICPDGKAVWWRSYRFPFRDSDGREYVAGSVVDITADKHAERKLQGYQRALEEANERLQSLATTDALTGLRNRRAFESSLTHEYELAQRYGHDLSLLILDIDNFKSFNDDFGHDEGDRVLKDVASALSSSFRSVDIAARYGGEEFAVILPHTAERASLLTAERMRHAVTERASGRRPVTVSVGLAAWAPGLTQRELVRHADDALYAAKRTGKNRVCVAAPEAATKE